MGICFGTNTAQPATNTATEVPRKQVLREKNGTSSSTNASDRSLVASSASKNKEQCLVSSEPHPKEGQPGKPVVSILKDKSKISKPDQFKALTLREVSPGRLRSLNSASNSLLSKVSSASASNESIRSLPKFDLPNESEDAARRTKGARCATDHCENEFSIDHQNSVNFGTGFILSSFTTSRQSISSSRLNQTTAESIATNDSQSLWGDHRTNQRALLHRGAVTSSDKTSQQTQLEATYEKSVEDSQRAAAEPFDKTFGHFLVETVEQTSYLQTNKPTQLSVFSTAPRSALKKPLTLASTKLPVAAVMANADKEKGKDEDELKLKTDISDVLFLNNNNRKRRNRCGGGGEQDEQFVELRSLWKDQPVVIQFFRRFGCPLCRNTALKISALGNVLAANGVKLVGVGLSKVSLEGMIRGNYFRGYDIYVDRRKQLYTALDFAVSSFSEALSTDSLALNKERVLNGVRGDFSPKALRDSRQLGGTFVVARSGKLLFEFRQKKYGDLPDFEQLFESLKLDKSLLKQRDRLPFELKQKQRHLKVKTQKSRNKSKRNESEEEQDREEEEEKELSMNSDDTAELFYDKKDTVTLG